MFEILLLGPIDWNHPAVRNKLAKLMQKKKVLLVSSLFTFPLENRVPIAPAVIATDTIKSSP
jgi:hypothetical protein